MAKKFRPLLHLAFRHSFFNRNNEVCRDLELAPMAATLASFRRYDLRLHEDPTGFGLYYGEENNLKPPVLSAGETLRLPFFIRVRNPYFINYSDLPLTLPENTLHYYNNLNPAEITDPLYGKFGSPAGLLDSILIRKTGVSFTHRTAPNGSAGRLVLNNASGPVKEDPDYPFATPDPDQNTLFRINLAQEDIPGYFELSGAGEGDEAAQQDVLRFFASDQEIGNDVFGIVELFLSPEKMLKPENGAEILQPVQYEIRFKARQTLWRYLVFQNNEHVYEDLSINGSNEASFHQWAPAGDALTPEIRQKATIFISDAPISLQEQSSRQFTLKLPGLGNGAEIRLPAPDIKTIKPEPDGSNDRKIYSDMYVYL